MRPIGADLFDEVGGMHNVSKTWCEEAYYSTKNRIESSSSAVEDEILRRYTKESGGFG